MGRAQDQDMPCLPFSEIPRYQIRLYEAATAAGAAEAEG